MPKIEENGQVAREVAAVQRDPRREFRYAGTGRLLASRDPVFVREARRRLAVYRDLARDGKVYECLDARYALTADAPFIVRPGPRRGSSPRAADRKAADMVKEQLDALGVDFDGPETFARARFDTGYAGLVYGLLDACLMGFSVGEVMWRREGSELVASEIRIREQERFRFDTDLALRLLVKSTDSVGERLPARKFLSYTFGSFWDPHGLSLGNRLFWPVKFKRHDYTFWLRFLDKYGSPTALGKVPSGGDKEVLLETVAAIQNNSAIVVDEDEAVDLLQSVTTAAQQGYEGLMRFLDNEIQGTILGTRPSRSASGDGSGEARRQGAAMASRKGQKDSRLLMAFLRKTLVRWIVDFNFGPDVPAPIIHGVFPDLDRMRDQAVVDNTLMQAGFRRSLDSVNDTYAFGEAVFSEVAPADSAGTSPETSGKAGADAREDAPSPERDAAED